MYLTDSLSLTVYGLLPVNVIPMMMTLTGTLLSVSMTEDEM